jgi:hypothetical protein
MQGGTTEVIYDIRDWHSSAMDAKDNCGQFSVRLLLSQSMEL